MACFAQGCDVERCGNTTQVDGLASVWRKGAHAVEVTKRVRRCGPACTPPFLSPSMVGTRSVLTGDREHEGKKRESEDVARRVSTRAKLASFAEFEVEYGVWKVAKRWLAECLDLESLGAEGAATGFKGHRHDQVNDFCHHNP